MNAKKTLFILTALSVVLLGIGVSILVEAKEPEVKVSQIEIPYGETVTNENIKEQFKRRGIKTVKIIKGKVIPNKIGVYPLTLVLITNNNYSFEHKMAVEVVDDKEPEVTIKEKIIEAGTDFNFANHVTIIDNADGDLTGRVDYQAIDTEKVGEQSTHISVNDSSGNQTKEKLTFVVKDTTKPTIELADINLTAGDSFEQLAEITAKDSLDGDLTKNIKVDGIVDSETVGTYTLTYHVSDQAGNKGEKKRNVTVEPAPIIEPANPNDFDNKQNGVVPEVNEATKATNEATNNPVSNEPVAEQASSPQATSPAYEAMMIYMAGSTIPYQNGGQGSGQAIIDNAPVASTWGGAAVQSGIDGLNTHIIGHNPGVFGALFGLGIGSQVIITDSTGAPASYSISRIFEVNDNAIGIADGVNYWDEMIGTGGGERVTFQTCENDHVNWVYIATR